MTDMPIDTITAHLNQPTSGLTPHQQAINIDLDLQRKFIFFPVAELEELEEQIEVVRDVLHIGQGAGYVSCTEDADIDELYTRAENTLALWWHLKQHRDALERRPEPGVYRARDVKSWFNVLVTEDRRVLVQQQFFGTLKDCSDMWDARGHKVWTMQRVNLTDGTVSA